jgi:tetratricopeptide (TPR) repeat protein
MPKAFQSRPRRGAPRRGASRDNGLPRGVLEEVRRTARPGQADEALSRLRRAVALLSRGDPAQAFREAERAKAAASRSGAVREVLALAYYGLERWRDALREAQAYRRITGRMDQNHIIADCYRALGSPEKAVPVAEEALRAPIPEEARAEAAIVAASALADLSRFDQALAMLRRLPSRPDVGRSHDLRVWYVTGDVLARAGRTQEAAREFRRILRHDRTAFDAAERLAELA